MRCIILLLGLACFDVSAQNYFDYISSNKGKYTLTGAFMFVSGVSDGVNQTIDFHYSDFKSVFPGAKDKFWNNDISWKNKYRDVEGGDYSPKFFGSTTFLAWTTDGYHLTRTAANLSVISGAAINFDGRKKLHWYLYDIAFFSLIKSLGFHFSYSLIFGKP
jgi:hypothetical protein